MHGLVWRIYGVAGVSVYLTGTLWCVVGWSSNKVGVRSFPHFPVMLVMVMMMVMTVMMMVMMTTSTTTVTIL